MLPSSFSCCLKSILGTVTSTPDSRDINQDFRLTCRGSVFITRCRQTRDGTDVDDSAERDGYGLKCSKTLIFKGLGRTGTPFTLHGKNAVQHEICLCYGSYGHDIDSDLYSHDSKHDLQEGILQNSPAQQIYFSLQYFYKTQRFCGSADSFTSFLMH